MAGPAHALHSVARTGALRAFLGSLAVHGIVVVALLAHKQTPTDKPIADPIELSVVQAMTPPAVIEEAAAEPANVARPKARILVKPAERPPPVIAMNAPPPSLPLAAPAPEPTKLIFGVSPESVTDNASDVAVPIGNTVATAPGNLGTVPIAVNPATSTLGGASGGTGSTPFAPVSESFVQQWPRTLEEIQAPYPEEARRVDMRGTVRLRVGIDENGRVREVKVIKRVGYGLDEAATKALWKFRFSPALGQDGRPVPFRINYNYIFNPPS